MAHPFPINLVSRFSTFCQYCSNRGASMLLAVFAIVSPAMLFAGTGSGVIRGGDSEWTSPRPSSKKSGPTMRSPSLIDETSPYPISLPDGLKETGGVSPALWTLEVALDRAFISNPDIIEARQAVEAQEGVRLQARARIFPQLSGVASIDKRAESLIDRSPDDLSKAINQRLALTSSGYDLRIEVRQMVFDGFTSWNQIRRQDLVRKQSYLTFLSTVNRTASLVRQAFDAILLRQRTLTLELRRIGDLKQLVDWSMRKQMAGEIAEFESLRAETEWQAAQAEAAEAKRNLAQAEQVFRKLLQIPDSDKGLQLDGELSQRLFDIDYESAVGRARAHRPDLESAQLRVSADKLQQRALMGELGPKIEVFASYGARSSYYEPARQLEGWTVGALGRWNFFDGGEHRGRTRAQLAERRVSEARLVEVEHQIVSQMRELFEGLAQAREALTARRKTADLALRATTQARRMFEAGQANIEQVLQSEVVWRRSENSMSEAIYNYNITVAQIEYAMGVSPDQFRSLSEPWKP